MDKIRDEKERDELYFFWKGAEGDYVILKKPLPGPGPWVINLMFVLIL